MPVKLKRSNGTVCVKIDGCGRELLHRQLITVIAIVPIVVSPVVRGTNRVSANFSAWLGAHLAA